MLTHLGDDQGHAVVDLVPTYRFHATNNSGPTYDIELLALKPTAITFTNPTPTPQPLPAQPTPAPASPASRTPSQHPTLPTASTTQTVP